MLLTSKIQKKQKLSKIYLELKADFSVFLYKIYSNQQYNNIAGKMLQFVVFIVEIKIIIHCVVELIRKTFTYRLPLLLLFIIK